MTKPIRGVVIVVDGLHSSHRSPQDAELGLVSRRKRRGSNCVCLRCRRCTVMMHPCDEPILSVVIVESVSCYETNAPITFYNIPNRSLPHDVTNQTCLLPLSNNLLGETFHQHKKRVQCSYHCFPKHIESLVAALRHGQHHHKSRIVKNTSKRFARQPLRSDEFIK